MKAFTSSVAPGPILICKRKLITPALPAASNSKLESVRETAVQLEGRKSNPTPRPGRGVGGEWG